MLDTSAVVFPGFFPNAPLWKCGDNSRGRRATGWQHPHPQLIDHGNNLVRRHSVVLGPKIAHGSLVFVAAASVRKAMVIVLIQCPSAVKGRVVLEIGGEDLFVCALRGFSPVRFPFSSSGIPESPDGFIFFLSPIMASSVWKSSALSQCKYGIYE